jgi:hypothetical protein
MNAFAREDSTLTFPVRRLLAIGAALGLALASVDGVAAAGSHAPRQILMPPRGASGHAKPIRSSNLSFHGGSPGVVKGLDKVYLVYWGSGWSSDPSNEAGIEASFFNHVGGSSWNASVTQYCDGVATGTITCGTNGNHATNPANVLAGTWTDATNAAPAQPTQTDLAGEAARAAAHFGNTTAAQNNFVQYVINTASGNNASGFGTQYCAWHSSTSSSYGTLAYTNMPYITDAGASCGANFNGLGPNAGITIVGGHEFAETESDIFPNGGWLDSRGSENGDKCAWISSGQGASQIVDFGGGVTLPVQSLWSNAFNSGQGGCVVSYP